MCLSFMHKIYECMCDYEILSVKKKKKGSTSNIKTIISHMLLRDSSYTQTEISKESNEDRIVRSAGGFYEFFLKSEYTRKRLVMDLVESNTTHNIDIRWNYASQVQFSEDENFLLLDETGFNMHGQETMAIRQRMQKRVRFLRQTSEKSQFLGSNK